MINKIPVLAIIVPCYNEEEVLEETAKRLLEIQDDLIQKNQILKESFIVFVDDGSKDKTWELIKEQNKKHSSIKGVKFSGNFGNQSALLAGFLSAKRNADCVVSIDADLQQDENAISRFVEKYREGYEIVYGVKKDRKADSLWKKLTGVFFYKLMNWMGVKIIKNHSEYRLVGKKALDALASYEETNLFLRGVFHIMGFKTTTLLFEIKERFAGQAKFTVRKLLSLAWQGITSFSTFPLRMIGIIGFLVFGVSILLSVYALLSKILGYAEHGWASTVLPMYLLGVSSF